jgi:hypothetical protein
MKRMLIFSVLIAFLFGAMAYATGTRVMTMGDVNNVVKDDANISLYPSTINYYPKLFVGEISSSSYFTKQADEMLYKIGANLGFGEDSEAPWVLGAYFSTEPKIPSILYDYYDKATPVETNNRISLTYGRVLGEIPFGFNVNLYNYSDKNEDTITANNYDQSLSTYEFNIGISPMEKKLDLAAGIGFSTWTDKDYYNATLGVVDYTKPKGNMDFMLNARYWMDPMGGWVLVPHAGLMYTKEGLESYYNDAGTWTLDYTEKYTEIMLNLGLGMNYDATENVLVVTDIGVNFDSYKDKYEYPDGSPTDEYKETMMALPYFKIGIDGQVFKWLDFRSGVVTQWQFDTWEPTDYIKEKYKYAVTTTYLGAGFHWNKLTLDASLNPDFLTSGPYFISGQSTSYDPFLSQVSLKYMF